jgi:hypothetical protein
MRLNRYDHVMRVIHLWLSHYLKQEGWYLGPGSEKLRSGSYI